MIYSTLRDLREALLSGLHPGATIRVDNDAVLAFVYHHDADGLDSDLECLWRSPSLSSCLHEALAELGLKSEDA